MNEKIFDGLDDLDFTSHAEENNKTFFVKYVDGFWLIAIRDKGNDLLQTLIDAFNEAKES